MLYFRIEELLKKKNKSKYWLCQNMNITSHNLNRVIRGETTSISFIILSSIPTQKKSSMSLSRIVCEFF